MQIVIDMSEHEYEVALRDGWIHTFYSEKIKNGTPLPKGHGRLVDEKEILNNPDGIYYDLYDVPGYLEECIPTVIEADKEVDE